MEKLTADVLVIGFGKGGKTAAHALSDAGKRVVLVEQSENMYGGTCPNVGCVPTKMLVHYSNARRFEDDAQEFFAHSIAGVRALTNAFRAGNFESLDGKDTATVITGTARFVDPHTVVVGSGDDRITVTAPTILSSRRPIRFCRGRTTTSRRSSRRSLLGTALPSSPVPGSAGAGQREDRDGRVLKGRTDSHC